MIPSVRNVTGLFLCASVTLLAACDAVPSNANLSYDLRTLLEQEFAPGLLDIVSVENDRPFTLWLSSDTEAVPFTAELRLERNHDFGSWQQANVAALLNVLGAIPEKTSGIKPTGNTAGDIIKVEGTVNYIRTNGEWEILSGIANRNPTNDDASINRAGLLHKAWAVARETVTSFGAPPHSDVIFEELEAARQAIAGRTARLNGKLALASGPEQGTYWWIAEAARKGAPETLVNIPTPDSLKSLAMLRHEKVSAAILQSNEAVMAASGTGPYESSGPLPTLRSLTTLFPIPVHVIVLTDSSTASVSDLIGKKVVVGDTGLTSLSEAGDVLRAHRVPLVALAEDPRALPLDEALAALVAETVDAVILTAAAPIKAVRDFMIETNVRLIPLDGDAIALMTSGTSSYVSLTIPARTYPGQRRPVATIATTALLVSTTAISAAEVRSVLETVLGKVDYVGLGSAIGAMISVNSAQVGLTLPLHPGAEAFFTPPATNVEN